MSFIGEFPKTARELLRNNLSNVELKREAFFCECIRATEPDLSLLLEKLESYRIKIRHKMTSLEKELIWIAMANISVKVLPQPEELMEVISSNEPSVMFPYLLGQVKILPSKYPIHTYNVGTFRLTLESLQHFVAEHPYHHETRLLWSVLRKHCFTRLMSKKVFYQYEHHETEVTMEDSLFDESEWCIRSVNKEKKTVEFHVNSLFIRSTEVYFHHIDESLRSRERWLNQIHLPCISSLKIKDLFRHLFGTIESQSWYVDEVQDKMNEMFAEFFIFPGEIELVRIMQPEAKSLSAAHAMSSIRGRELGLVSTHVVNKKPQDIYSWRRTYMKLDEELLHPDVDLPSASILKERGWYCWNEYYSSTAPRSFEESCLLQSYVLAFIASVSVIENVAPALGGQQTHLSNSLQTSIAFRSRWAPKNPRFWPAERFPCLVQTNDFRFHIALSSDTLLICPNIETAYVAWMNLRRGISRENTNSDPSDRLEELLEKMNA